MKIFNNMEVELDFENGLTLTLFQDLEDISFTVVHERLGDITQNFTIELSPIKTSQLRFILQRVEDWKEPLPSFLTYTNQPLKLHQFLQQHIQLRVATDIKAEHEVKLFSLIKRLNQLCNQDKSWNKGTPSPCKLTFKLDNRIYIIIFTTYKATRYFLQNRDGIQVMIRNLFGELQIEYSILTDDELAYLHNLGFIIDTELEHFKKLKESVLKQQ